MIKQHRPLRTIALALAAAIALFISLRAPATALGQDMDRSGVLDIRSEEERTVFNHLQCTCGCPRESIGTCTCGFANGFRNDARAMMAKGMTLEEIKAEWARRYGPRALMVPPDTSTNSLLYILPPIAVAGMAAFAVTLLRRLRRHADEKATAAPAPVAGGARDEYDDKLDEELKQLDDE